MLRLDSIILSQNSAITLKNVHKIEYTASWQYEYEQKKMSRDDHSTSTKMECRDKNSTKREEALSHHKKYGPHLAQILHAYNNKLSFEEEMGSNKKERFRTPIIKKKVP